MMISLYFIVFNPYLVYTEVVHREFANLHCVLNWGPLWFIKWKEQACGMLFNPFP